MKCIYTKWMKIKNYTNKFNFTAGDVVIMKIISEKGEKFFSLWNRTKDTKTKFKVKMDDKDFYFCFMLEDKCHDKVSAKYTGK